MSGGRIDPRAVPSSNLRAQIIGAMLGGPKGSGRYLFVLDGLEVMQHQEGDQYGLLQSSDLRDLLTFFARPDNQSFCLITSRAPLLDLMDYTTYTHRDVDRLSEEDGRALLQRLSVKGSDAEFNKVVADWDGHALTLSILAAYLAERYEGDIKHLADIPVPTADEPRYERVHRVLRRYDEHLSKDEREFLKLFSVFRLPVQESAFEKVFVLLLKPLDKEVLLKFVSRLANYRLIRHDEHQKTYTIHPLTRYHYFALFTKDDLSKKNIAHKHIKDYYLSTAGRTPEYPTLNDLKPLIEAVHHACQGGEYDEGISKYQQRISRGDQFVLLHQLGAYETTLNLMYEFFPEEVSNEPKASYPNHKSIILGTIGLCLMTLGRIKESIQFHERSNQLDIDTYDFSNASQGYQNLADIYISLGRFDEGTKVAQQALDFARHAENKFHEAQSLSYQAWIAHLLGSSQLASNLFQRAEKNERVHTPSVRYLYSIRGIFHANFLRRVGQSKYALSVTEENLNVWVNATKWPKDESACHIILGDLDIDSGRYISAREHFELALKIARSIPMKQTLIEALLARGRWQAKHMKSSSDAFNDLNEALGYCVEGGYRIYEADVRVALAWAYLANDEKEKARQSAERALQMSNEMGYHWGKVDAEEALKNV